MKNEDLIATAKEVLVKSESPTARAVVIYDVIPPVGGSAREAWRKTLIAHPDTITALCRLLLDYHEALGKIADPRKRDHKEPDAYTTLGCVMNIASEALAAAGKGDAG